MTAYPDFRRMVSIPVRDTQNGGKIAFVVDVYGITAKDLYGDAPVVKAISRIGLDPMRYRALVWDVPNNR